VKQSAAEEQEGSDAEMEDEEEEKHEDFLLCEKCLRMSQQLNGPTTSWFTEILLNQKNLE
jgi:hypothetical protein